MSNDPPKPPDWDAVVQRRAAFNREIDQARGPYPLFDSRNNAAVAPASQPASVLNSLSLH